MEGYRLTVTDAASLLDRAAPNWFRRVNLDTLDLSSRTMCVLGQLFGDYSEGRRLISYHDEEGLCMNIAGSGVFSANAPHRDEWMEAIAQRLRAAPVEQKVEERELVTA